MNDPILSAKVATIEKLMIELSLVAIHAETTPQRSKQRLNDLLSDMEFAGLEEQEAQMRRNEKH